MNDTLGNGTDSSIYSIYMPVYITDLAIDLTLVLPSNIYVLWLILSGAGGTIASDFFYINLTASLIISTLTSVFHFAGYLTGNFILMNVAFFIVVLFFWFSVPWFQCCICVERYIAVVHPVVFLRYKALRYRVACCCVVWLMVIALSLCSLWLPTVVGYIFLGFSIVCISVLSFCCLSVLRALKQPGPGEGQRDSGNDMKRRAFRIILISLVVMVGTTIMLCIPLILSELNQTTELVSRVAFFYHICIIQGVRVCSSFALHLQSWETAMLQLKGSKSKTGLLTRPVCNITPMTKLRTMGDRAFCSMPHACGMPSPTI